ncbi:MAG TPA: hypothetical protein VE690_21175 [Rhodopila sp.]|nr:hypothetical protein [Rhodopila sp.]
MRVLLIAAVAAVIGAGSAFAQGLPPGTTQEYGTHAFPNQPYQDKTVFSQLLERFQTNHNAPVRSAETSAKTQQGS